MVLTRSNAETRGAQYGAYIQEDWEALTFRVNRSALRDDAVYAREREAIWDRVWLYAGHETEIPQPGDWKVRTVGGRSLIFSRDVDGKVNLYYNTCPHRGTTLCRAENEGNDKVFRCFYHAWTFNTKGELVGLPGAEGYPGDGFRERYTMRRPARQESIRGFVFVSFNPDAVALRDHLGGAAEYIELFSDHGADGIAVVPGTQEYSVKANWKMAVENALDGYHFSPTHATYIDWLNETGYKVSDEGEGGVVDYLGNGHCALVYSGHGGRVGLLWEPRYGETERERIEQNRAAVVQRLGSERGQRLASKSRILFIFPNVLLFDIASLAVRLLEPTAAGSTDVTAWELAPVGEPAERTALRIRMLGAFIGPGGLATPDDIEAYEAVQRGIRNTAGDRRPGVDWNDISRGMAQEKAGGRPRSIDEYGIRSFYRHWASLMNGTAASTGATR